MKIRFAQSSFILAILCVLSFPAQRLNAADTPKRVLFFSKSSGYEHSAIQRTGNELSVAEKILQQIGEKNNFQFTFSKDGGIFTSENIAKYDAFFFYTTGDLTEAGTDKNPPMSKEGKAAFLKAIESGKGFIGTHSASDTFHSPGNEDHGPARFKSDGESADPYVKMLGAEFIRHGEQQKSHMICVEKKFPGINAVPEDFALLEEWYSLKNFATNLHVLLVQETREMKGNMYQRPPYPATWARMHGNGRVFYTSMGHREDVWANPVFQEVLTGAINWAAKNVDADVNPNINEATPKANELPPSK